MRTRHGNTLTATGIARTIIRGLRANYAPDHQQQEIGRLAELFGDLAMSRAMDAEHAQSETDEKLARRDADWLDAIATEMGH